MSNLIDNAPDTDNVESYEQVLSDSDIDNMSDEEFEAYINSRTIPERLHSSTTEEVEEETVNNQEVETTEEEVIESNEESTEEITEEQTEVEEEVVEEEVDYRKAYEELLNTPIKADGTEITLKNKEELISLAQKGVNYTRKTQELAKDRKLVESIREANISNDDLNMLIDVYKGNKEAIKSLVKKHNIEIDSYEDEESKYVPGNNIVSDVEVDMLDIVDEIKRSPHQQKISNIINNDWDRDSVELLRKDPSLLRGLFEEVSGGRFDEIQKIVAYEKIFDKNHIPDIVRYAGILERESSKNQQTQPTTVQAKPKVRPVAGDKKSASIQTNTSKTIKKQLTDEDLDNMSDEDFIKFYKNNK